MQERNNGEREEQRGTVREDNKKLVDNIVLGDFSIVKY